MPPVRVVPPREPEVGAGKLLTSTSAITSPPIATEPPHRAKATEEIPKGDSPITPSAPRRGVGERDYNVQPIEIYYTGAEARALSLQASYLCTVEGL